MLIRCSIPRLGLAASLGTSQLLTRSPVDLALALFVCRCCLMIRRIAATAIKLTLDGSYFQRNAVKAFCQTKCLHALSSFQRTGNPTRLARSTATLDALPALGLVGDPTDRLNQPDSGEPFEVTSPPKACQPFFRRRACRPLLGIVELRASALDARLFPLLSALRLSGWRPSSEPINPMGSGRACQPSENAPIRPQSSQRGSAWLPCAARKDGP